MSLLNKFRSRPHEGAAVAEKPACLHTTLTPRWDELDDIGHDDRITEYVCESCGTAITPVAAAKLHVTTEQLVGPGPAGKS